MGRSGAPSAEGSADLQGPLHQGWRPRMHPPALFARPDGDRSPLGMAPRSASWMSAGHPAQVHFEESLAHAVGLLIPRQAHAADPLALRPDVGLPSEVHLLDAHDLDNYVHPLTMRLTKDTQRQVACAWATKCHAATSLIGIEQAVPRDDQEQAGGWLHVHTSASSEASAYEEQIDDALRSAVELPEGPVAVELSSTVGPSRNWSNLWKPTIDAPADS